MNAQTDSAPAVLEEQGVDAWHGTNLAGDKVELAIARHRPEYQDDLRWLWGWACEKNYSQADLARKLEVSAPTISRVLAANYINPKTGEMIAPPAPMMAIIRRLRQEAMDAQQRSSSYVRFPTVDIIWEHMHRVAARDDNGNTVPGEPRNMGFVIGESQVGKTQSALWYRERFGMQRTGYLTVEGVHSEVELYRRLARMLYISQDNSLHRLKERVKAAINPTMLIIVDEWHWLLPKYQPNAGIRLIETLRALYDETKCAMCNISTNIGLEEMIGGKDAQILKQTYRRGCSHILRLSDKNHIRDMRAIFKHFGFPFPTAGAQDTYQRAITNSSGDAHTVMRSFFNYASDNGLKQVFDTLRRAAAAADRNGLPRDHALLCAVIAAKAANEKPEEVL